MTEELETLPAQTVAEPEVEKPKSELAPLHEEISQLRKQLGLAVAKYRLALLARFPEVPEELVSGASVEAVDASLAAARGIVEKVRASLEARAAAERVPAGAPVRALPELTALSPREKIAFALSRGR
ncbi:MAG: hypothetical protein HYX99_00275 [Chloroflexi bacterium]|nr:hypothetical protein [Chloroflexota bacterium]